MLKDIIYIYYDFIYLLIAVFKINLAHILYMRSEVLLR
jgi:hypothetical protein